MTVASQLLTGFLAAQRQRRTGLWLLMCSSFALAAGLSARGNDGYFVAAIATPALVAALLLLGQALLLVRDSKTWMKEELVRAILIDSCSPFDSVSVDALVARLRNETASTTLTASGVAKVALSMLDDGVLRVESPSGGLLLQPYGEVTYVAPWTRYRGVTRPFLAELAESDAKTPDFPEIVP